MVGTAPFMPGSLQSRRVLVAEDEYLIAELIAEVLSEAGAETLGPVPSVTDALRLVAGEDQIDCALLDVNLGNATIWPAVDMLMTRGVPVILTTGYDASGIPPAYIHLPRCEKPFSGREIACMLARVLAAQPFSIR